MQQPSPFRGANWQRPALALLALALGLFSFYWAQQHPEYAWDGPIILAVAAVLVAFLLRRPPTSDSTPDSATAAPIVTTDALPPVMPWWKNATLQWRIWLIGVSVFLTVVLLSNLITNTQPTYLPHFLGWLAAIAAFTIAVAPPRSVPTFEWRLWWDVNRTTALIVGAIVVGALLLRTWDLEHIPWTLGGDEGSQGLEAIKILNGEIRNPFTTGWLSVPTMSFFFNTITIGPLGRTITALRLPWAFIGVATVLVLFWLVTRMFGVKLGLVSAALLATYHYHIHFSRLGSNQVADPFFIVLALFFLYKAKDTESPFNFAMAGVTVGVAQYFYAGARLTMIMLAAVLLYFIWLERSRPENLKKMARYALIAAGAFLITAAPMLQYAVRFPNDYNARINEVGIFQHGWVEREMTNRGVGVITLLWEQFQKAFLMFNYYPDTTVWYGTPHPAMEGLWSVLFMVGLLYCTLRVFTPKSEPRYFPFVVWWWTGMILGGVLTENPPSYQRMITLAPPAVFFVSYVLYRVVMVVQNALPRREENGRKVSIPFAVPALAIVVTVLSFLSIRFYFTEFVPLNPYGGRNGEIATGMAKQMLAEMQDDQVPVFLGPPLMYIGFGSIPYLEPRSTQGFNVDNPLTSAADVSALPVPVGKRPLFFSVPGRAFELDFVEQAYPGGERRQINDTKGNLLYWVYVP